MVKLIGKNVFTPLSPFPLVPSPTPNFSSLAVLAGVASFPCLPHLQFFDRLHTASDQKMEVRKAWERGYAGGPGTFPHVSDVKTVEICGRAGSQDSKRNEGTK